MDFGKLDQIDHVTFDLPSEPEGNLTLLRRYESDVAPQLYLGPTGYNMKAWVGKWYPPGARDRDFLKHYAAQFNAIEHNTTHYRIPDSATVTRWREETAPDFKFCPKIPQTISHAPDLGLLSPETLLFCDAIRGLEEKLGHCFMQLPPGFSPRSLKVLEKFLDRFPPDVPLAIEVRHPAFFQHDAASEAYFELLTEKGVATVITDVAGRRDVCHLRLTQPTVLIRFVGNGLHPTDFSRVEEWAQRLKTWIDAGLQAAYFFCHEPDNLLAPELTEYALKTFTTAMPHTHMRGPREVGGRQGLLFPE